MIPRPSGDVGRFGVFAHCLALLLCSLAGSFCVRAQTQQPFLFATTSVNGTSAVGTFARNDASGALTEVANSPFALVTAGCGPTTMDVKGRFLFGPCGDGVALYDLNAATGAVSEAPHSPFATSTGGAPQAVIAESTGQYVYAVRVAPATYPTPSTVTLDAFSIDSVNNALAPPTTQPPTQTFTLPGTYLGVVTDPNHHFLQIYMAVAGGPAPQGEGCGILFDLTTGLPKTSATGFCVSAVGGGSNPNTAPVISIDAKGTLIGTAARGQILSSVDVTALSPADGSFQASGTFTFSTVDEYPGAPVFDPTSQIAYVSTSLSGLRIFGISVAQSTVTITELPSSPFPSTQNSAPLFGLANPVADFMYVGGSNAISAYPIDTTTGYLGPSVPNNLSHSPALNYQPVLATLPPPGQAVSAPAVMIGTQSLSFGPINPNQVSGPQMVMITSTGSEALAISSLAFNPNGGPFTETDTCLAHPVLAPGTSCTIMVSYAPTAVGTSQASLVITDNAAGSPQNVALTGTAVAPPPPAPAVTLQPGTLNFPGTTTQGTLSARQTISITNSGNATLNFSAAPTLNGVNTADFSITASSCAASLTANTSCSVAVVFGPQASGVRTTNLIITDNAANSPQSVTINGTATPAAMFAAQAGASTSATVNAGQPAQFNLQATPGTGFSGMLTFTCLGLPMAANCSAPGVTVAGGATANFSVTVTTSGSGAMAASAFHKIPGRFSVYPMLAVLLLVLLGVRLGMRPRKMQTCFPRRNVWVGRVAWLCFAVALGGCGGGGGSTQPLQQVTPSGKYTIMVTPSATPAGSTKSLPMAAIPLTLKVN
jgi:hypothetical protein